MVQKSEKKTNIVTIDDKPIEDLLANESKLKESQNRLGKLRKKRRKLLS